MTTSAPSRILVWLRRDLRTHDHAALSAALAQAQSVHCAFVYDRDILDALPDRDDRRVAFIHEALAQVHAWLAARGGGLAVLHERAADAIPRLARLLNADAVYANHDDEPAARRRDDAVARALAADGRLLVTFKDQVIFERDEVLTAAGRPFTVFTPYRNAWMRRLDDASVAARAVDGNRRFEPPPPGMAPPSLEAIGFAPPPGDAPTVPAGMSGARALLEAFSERIDRYDAARNYPALRGPSYLSAHLRFGTVSVREAVRLARDVIAGDPQAATGARTWLSELTWRDFYFQILYHHPHVETGAFKPAFERIKWVDGAAGDRLFDAWCAGATGYPLVDAAMLQLSRSGYMHNRLRMVTASFLVKDLGVDWRRGEHWFARKLLDFDLAANNGGWQWSASTGCDAQPWFRIFNPLTQSRTFDAQGRFIRRYLPQLANLSDKATHAPWLAPGDELARAGVQPGKNYPLPIVDHAQARAATLERYAVVKDDSAPQA